MDGAAKRRLGNDLLENKLMKKFLLGTVALIALGATAPALAADMAARPYTKAPAYSAPIYNWTGFYIGGHVVAAQAVVARERAADVATDVEAGPVVDRRAVSRRLGVGTSRHIGRQRRRGCAESDEGHSTE